VSDGRWQSLRHSLLAGDELLQMFRCQANDCLKLCSQTQFSKHYVLIT
tara:strand:- start:403 stop:546 length:144 start_codon:yes stop_codon:yes gene_type:complete